MSQEICYNCEGRGHGDGDMWLFVCPRCNGSGVLKSAQWTRHQLPSERSLLCTFGRILICHIGYVYYWVWSICLFFSGGGSLAILFTWGAAQHNV